MHTGVFNNGRFGVQLFFLISGYLLADLAIKDSAKFLVRRAFRLFPLYLLFLIIFYRNDYQNFWHFLISVFLMQNIFWGFNSFAGAWSISNEWIFSLMVPLLIRLKKHQVFILIVLSWISQLITSYVVKSWGGIDSPDVEKNYELKTWLNTFNPLINLCFFLIGFAIKRNMIPLVKNKLLCVAVVLIGSSLTFIFGHGLLMIWPPVLYSLFCLCIDFTSKNRLIKNLISYIGKRTYGIFFLHFLLIPLVQNFQFLKVVHESDQIYKILVFVTVFTLSAIVSELLWILVEKPWINVSRSFRY